MLAPAKKMRSTPVNADDLLHPWAFTDRDGDTDNSASDLTGSHVVSNGTLTDNEDGTYSFEPAAELQRNRLDQSYYVDDNNGIKVFSTNEFTLNAVNDDS